jgi:hypothetical protein
MDRILSQRRMARSNGSMAGSIVALAESGLCSSSGCRWACPWETTSWPPLTASPKREATCCTFIFLIGSGVQSAHFSPPSAWAVGRWRGFRSKKKSDRWGDQAIEACSCLFLQTLPTSFLFLQTYTCYKLYMYKQRPEIQSISKQYKWK